MSVSTRIFWLIVAVLFSASVAFAIGAERKRAEQRDGAGASSGSQ